ncbi:uncharacterized protein DS421_19g669870 [Arachis hypogaea]|uniref:Uncharacterized protein n=1 Tax=Arachis hypogaea TaxID=3818 RepID=A0A6B9VD27_ARAHY|nr:uncharacterized protein DS421_19g669870 [Arachis hypogaea]
MSSFHQADAQCTLTPGLLSLNSWSSLTSVQPPPATSAVGTSNSQRLLPHFPSIAQQPSQPSFPSIAQPLCERGSLRRAATPPPALALLHRCHCPVRSPFEGAPCLGVSVSLLIALLKASSF